MQTPQIQNPATPWTTIAWILFILALPTGLLTLIPALICAAISSSLNTRHNNYLIERGITIAPPPPTTPRPRDIRSAPTLIIPIIILTLLASAAAILFAIS